MRRQALSATLGAFVTLATMLNAQEPQENPMDSTFDGVYSVLDYGAARDGSSDATTAFQTAIDRAEANGGGKVYLPPGRYLIGGSLRVGQGVAVVGANEAPMAIEPLVGSIVMATGGRDDESAPALFEMGHASTVKGLTVWYPDQKPEDIHPYPWTFHLQGFDNTVENITLINSYNAISVGPEVNVRHRIRSVYGCALRRGIVVDACVDIGRIENVQFHCHWWSAESVGGKWDPVFTYMIENFEAFTFARTDWEYVTNNFVFPAKVGYRFIKSEPGPNRGADGMCNGQFTGNGADACETCVLVEAIQPMGLLFTGGQFVAFTGNDPVQIRTSETFTGNVRFSNCSFWGMSEHNAVLQGQGTVSFTDCFLSNWKEGVDDQALIVAESGRLQVNNCTFSTRHPAVRVGADVPYAIIQGSNGPFGVRVEDASGKAIQRDNEAPPATPEPETDEQTQ
jgi:hypothetical protein